MLQMIKKILRSVGMDTTRLYQSIMAASLKAAIRSQGLAELCTGLRKIIPDVSDQYTTDFDPVEYDRFWEVKMRGLHAFQVQSTLDALNEIGGKNLVIADLGDSSGNHSKYLTALAAPGQTKKVISVNLDPVAVEKVKSKGGEAILSRVENLDHEGLAPDLIMTFEMVEHLTDPVRFFHSLATEGSADYVLVTVPYTKTSRFGGHHIRVSEDRMQEQMTAEEVHVFELSPDDWSLLTRFAGFKTVFLKTYLQYPAFHPLSLTKHLWRATDHEGFIALLLKRDLSVANRYTSW